MKSLTFSYLTCDLSDSLFMRYFRKKKLIQNLLSTKLIISLISNITGSVSTYKYKLKQIPTQVPVNLQQISIFVVSKCQFSCWLINCQSCKTLEKKLELGIAHNIPYVRNKEDFTMLCSVINHAKSGESKKELWRETRDVGVLLDFNACFYAQQRMRRAILRNNN